MAFYNCPNIVTINNDSENKNLSISPSAFFVSTSVTTKITKNTTVSNGDVVDTNFKQYNFMGDNREQTNY
jgi:hypothetical protein